MSVVPPDSKAPATAGSPAPLTWIQKILGPPEPGSTPPPPITAPEMIPERRAAISLDRLNVDLPEVAEIHEGVVLRERADYTLTAEVIVPRGEGPFPVVLYMHGGAWCVWGPRDVRRITTTIAARGYVVVSLDYGLAPEHPFPCAVHDTIYAARWAVVNAERYGGIASPIAVGGDSCGTTLASSAMAFLNGYEAEVDEGDLAGVDVEFFAALFHCGAFNLRSRMNERDTTPGTTEIMAVLSYLGTRFLAKQLDPMASPYFAPNLSTFPPVYLNSGTDDAVLPQNFSMAEKLIEHGVSTTVSILPGCDHEYFLWHPSTPAIQAEWERVLSWLDEQAQAANLPTGAPAVATT
jgi:acetyl esterase